MDWIGRARPATLEQTNLHELSGGRFVKSLQRSSTSASAGPTLVCLQVDSFGPLPHQPGNLRRRDREELWKDASYPTPDMRHLPGPGLQIDSAVQSYNRSLHGLAPVQDLQIEDQHDAGRQRRSVNRRTGDICTLRRSDEPPVVEQNTAALEAARFDQRVGMKID